MNWFTKSELQIILLDMDTYIQMNKILRESPIHRELRLKIQSMIDDYSEHECSHHEPIRLSLLSQKDYDFCETCLYVRRIR